MHYVRGAVADELRAENEKLKTEVRELFVSGEELREFSDKRSMEAEELRAVLRDELGVMDDMVADLNGATTQDTARAIDVYKKCAALGVSLESES